MRLPRSRDPRGDGGETRRVRCPDCGAQNLPRVRCGCTFHHVRPPAAVLAFGSGDREERARARARALSEPAKPLWTAPDNPCGASVTDHTCQRRCARPVGHEGAHACKLLLIAEWEGAGDREEPCSCHMHVCTAPGVIEFAGRRFCHWCSYEEEESACRES